METIWEERRRIVRQKLAWLPVAMSAAALVLVVTDVAVNGAPRGSDEGAVAHMFQILMAGQLPIIAVFLATWLPRNPRQAVRVLAMQAGAAAAACAPVFLMRL